MQIHHDVSLAEVLWYKIGGKTKYLLDVASTQDAKEAIEFIITNNIQKVFVVGHGANLIFTDNDFDGAIIRMVKPQTSSFTRTENTITAFAGEVLGETIEYGFECNLIGMQWAGGLPGTVGAAVRGNVGAFGGEIKDTLVSAEVMEITANGPLLKTFRNQELTFAYRHSLIKENRDLMVISATFGLTHANQQELVAAKAVYQKSIDYRKARHPLEYPNCGSVFKNIKKKDEVEKVLQLFPDLKEQVTTKWHGKVAVANLIEAIGMKGYRIGNAQISEKHALFIVNLGGAKAKDVCKIIHDIQAKFQETFGFSLEPEVEIVV